MKIDKFIPWVECVLILVIIRWPHRGRVTHICISKLNYITLDNGLLPYSHPAIMRANADILLIGNNFQWNLNQNTSNFI